MLEHNDKIFACGTHAFSPKCSWREAKQLRSVTEWVDGRARCPYSPEDNSTAIMTESGDYYIGSATDFSSNDHAIYRWSGEKVDKNALRTLQYNSHWVSQPDFVGSFEDEKFVYFVFREPAVEFMNCGKAVYSRIARVCKSDRNQVNYLTFCTSRKFDFIKLLASPLKIVVSLCSITYQGSTYYFYDSHHNTVTTKPWYF